MTEFFQNKVEYRSPRTLVFAGVFFFCSLISLYFLIYPVSNEANAKSTTQVTAAMGFLIFTLTCSSYAKGYMNSDSYYISIDAKRIQWRIINQEFTVNINEIERFELHKSGNLDGVNIILKEGARTIRIPDNCFSGKFRSVEMALNHARQVNENEPTRQP